ncbi:MAG: 50S ribosomal protein L11 methyltransferase, partial [Desulfobacterales bacterium]|nr:50S ribosomal protein L11 methyltransferase [Desulfobacterales bacterium]
MTTFRTDDAKIRQSILERLGRAGSKYTPMDLEREVCGQEKISKKAVRRAVKTLMAENRLTYTQFLGHTFVEISHKRAVKTGDWVILAPPDAVVNPRPKQIVVRIEAGAAFGAGDHPTTRMALKLAAWVFHDHILPEPAQN